MKNGFAERFRCGWSMTAIFSAAVFLAVVVSASSAVVFSIVSVPPAVVLATPSVQPEVRSVINNVWKNNRQYLIDQISTYVNGDGSTSESYTLYDMGTFTGSLLYYAKVTGDRQLLDELAEVYLAAFPKLATNMSQYVYSYWPAYHGVSNNLSVHALSPPASMWIDTPKMVDGVSIGAEDVLPSAQFVYQLAQMCNAIADIPPAERGGYSHLNTFITNYVPVILNDHYKRWIFAANTATSKGVFGVHGYTGTNQLYNHSEFLQHKYARDFHGSPTDWSYMNAVKDDDMYIITGVVEMLAANQKDSTNIPISGTIPGGADFKTSLYAYAKLGSDLLASRLTDSALLNFTGEAATGANFDVGVWDDHPDYFYSGCTNATTPQGLPHQPANDVGWDISHARRFISTFNTLRDNYTILQAGYSSFPSFPTDATMTKLANQLVYGAFNKDLNQPLTANYMTGTNGWYRVGYSYNGAPPDEGFPPYGFPQEGALAGYNFWAKYNPDIAVMENAIWNKIRTLYTTDVSGHFREGVTPVAIQLYSSGANPRPLSSYALFDGTTNNSLSLGGDTEYISPTGSIEFWFYPTGPIETDSLIFIAQDANNSLGLQRYYGNNLRLVIKENSIYRTDYYSANNTITIDQWNHVVLTQDGSGPKFYINGTAVPGTGTSSDYWTAHLPIINSFLVSSIGGPFLGRLDGLRVYSRALSAAEVNSNFKSKCAVAHWTFDSAHYYSSTSNVSLVTGKIGQGMCFNGTNSVCQSYDSADFVSTNGAVQFWFKLDDLNTNRDIVWITSGDNSTNNNGLLIRKIASTDGSNPNKILVQMKNGSVYSNQYSSVAVTNLSWNHLAVSQDGVSGLKIYLNGNPASSANTAKWWTGHIVSNTAHVRLGDTAWSDFKGTLDELQIFKGAFLSSNDVQNSYSNGIGSSATKVYGRTFDWGSEAYQFNTARQVPGIIGQAVSFSGTGKSYYQSAAISNLASARGSIQLFFKLSEANAGGDLVFITSDNSLGSDYLLVKKCASTGANPNKIFFQTKLGSSLQEVVSGSAITDTNWHHLAVTQDGRGVQMYIDGVLNAVGGAQAVWTAHLDANAHIRLGGVSLWPASYYNGMIDELQVFNEALSPDQIKTESNRRYLLADWEFDEPQDTNAVNFIMKYYGADYNATDSLSLLRFLPSLLTRW
ncbi:MAG: hypothetical protein IT583_00605 [Verrucomicrobia bacterium]|nr:hypothetical protein [Verrucomicrobiota bacterium]